MTSVEGIQLTMPAFSQKNPLWQFLDDRGTFRVQSPERVSRLYFPLANEAGILSSITPDLHGDIKTSHNSFLTQPVSIEDLHNTKSNRNFWIHIEGHGAWSATGVSALQQAERFEDENKEKVSLDAGMLWHKITRENNAIGLKAEIVNFVPVGPDTLEIMIVSITNTGRNRLKITPTSAIPIFGRSADNLRDHYHVTSLLHRVLTHPAGVIVKPTMSFDERGHKINEKLYCVLGAMGSGELPVGAFSTVPDFIGEGGSFETPKAVLENRPTPQKDGVSYHGKSAIGALRFRSLALAPRQKASFVLLLGIADKENQTDDWMKRYGSLFKAEAALKENQTHWSQRADLVRFRTFDKNHDGWLRWVSLQPTLRKLFGCSFLPDFDYGRGGRGWRDLWQDCLALLLVSPDETRQILLNNFNGVRIDGSNATIIGSESNEFVSDRNNITRVWMDHGIWPYLTTELYIHQTGDLGILFQNAKYFRDKQLWRARKKDPAWTENDPNTLKDKAGKEVKGSILEHLLVQHLVQFFNVGEHNHIRLENADWNDGLDMAYERGESVAFSCLYGSNLRRLALLLEHVAQEKDIKKITLAKELLHLLDRASGHKVNYESALAKKNRLAKYFDCVQPEISGRQVEISIQKVIEDLRAKSDFITEHVRQREWIQTRQGDGLYNGYYDNHGHRVEGDSPRGHHMTLAGQVFPIMSGVATAKQVEDMFKTTKKYLQDKEHGGFRLNTDFHEIRPDLGRAFSFAYGEKENGAFFSHMVVMFAYALYERKCVNEGREVLESLYRMCLRTEKSKIYPGIPEYFNSEGRGLYHYLTGSASWLVLTMLTQVYGVRGFYGDLLLSPKLAKSDFGPLNEVSVWTFYAGYPLQVIYKNSKKIPYEHYCISKVTVNGKEPRNTELNKKEVLIRKEIFLKLARKSANIIVVTLE